MRTRNMRQICSLTDRPAPTQATMAAGKSTASTAVAANALEVHPPHLRYQPKRKVRLTIQATSNVTPIQSIRKGSGRGGRSGFTKRHTRGIAKRANGTFTQKIQRQESASLTRAVNSGVVGRVA